MTWQGTVRVEQAAIPARTCRSPSFDSVVVAGEWYRFASLSRSTFHRKRYDLAERNVITGPEISRTEVVVACTKLIFDFALSHFPLPLRFFRRFSSRLFYEVERATWNVPTKIINAEQTDLPLSASVTFVARVACPRARASRHTVPITISNQSSGEHVREVFSHDLRNGRRTLDGYGVAANLAEICRILARNSRQSIYPARLNLFLRASFNLSSSVAWLAKTTVESREHPTCSGFQEARGDFSCDVRIYIYLRSTEGVRLVFALFK